jgi:hypothetical protein
MTRTISAVAWRLPTRPAMTAPIRSSMGALTPTSGRRWRWSATSCATTSRPRRRESSSGTLIIEDFIGRRERGGPGRAGVPARHFAKSQTPRLRRGKMAGEDARPPRQALAVRAAFWHTLLRIFAFSHAGERQP